jgi:hypothetical protein
MLVTPSQTGTSPSKALVKLWALPRDCNGNDQRRMDGAGEAVILGLTRTLGPGRGKVAITAFGRTKLHCMIR